MNTENWLGVSFENVPIPGTNLSAYKTHDDDNGVDFHRLNFIDDIKNENNRQKTSCELYCSVAVQFSDTMPSEIYIYFTEI